MIRGGLAVRQAVQGFLRFLPPPAEYELPLSRARRWKRRSTFDT